MMPAIHQPVLVNEVLRELAIRPGNVVLDATIGMGGHAERFLEAVGSAGWLIGIDRDEEALDYARVRLERFQRQMKLVHGHFGVLASVLNQLHVDAVDAVLFDLGVSSFQLETSRRGFSFSREGPLDMRMDQTEGKEAAEIVNHYSLQELVELLTGYGEERWAKRIARAIVRERPMATTVQLAQVIRRALPPAARSGRIDPATRTFQAIRIAVNQELELLLLGLNQAIDCLRPPGRIAVLAYHSLEDRIVKTTFREQSRAARIEILTKKPIKPSPEEVRRNPRSRSACLRVAQRLSESETER